MRKNRKLSWILTIAFVFSTIVSLPTFPVMAGCQDINGHWAKPQIEHLMAQKIINGYPDNTFKPENPISRAEFIVITNKAFNFNDSAAINYSDVKPTDWFAADIARAKAARYISGYEDGTMKPDQQISRQEAASIVARILALKSADTNATLQRFSDNETIANWSRDSIAAMVENGYLKGYPDNSFKPANSIKRAEAAVLFKIVLDRDQDDLQVEPKPEIQSLFDQAGTYGPKTGTQVINEDVTISASGVILQNIIIEKDLIIAKEVGDGDVTLNNVTVKGKTYVRGGGKDSIHINGGQYSEIIIEQTATGQVRIVAVDTSGLRVTISENAKGEEIILNGDFKSVTVNADDVNISTQGDTNIGELRVQNGLQGVNIELSRDSTVNEMVLNSKTNVEGQGTIEKASGSKASDSSFTTQPGTIAKPSTGGGGGGGGGGSSAVVVSAISVTGTGGATTITEDKGTLQMVATVTPSNASNTAVTWDFDDNANDTGSATIDTITGLLTAKVDGTVTVRATSVSTPSVTGTVVITISGQEEVVEPVEADLTAYNAALAAVVEADYTAKSWATYQAVVDANVITVANTQEEVDAATAAITAAQGSLVKAEILEAPADGLKNLDITGLTTKNVRFLVFGLMDGKAQKVATLAEVKSYIDTTYSVTFNADAIKVENDKLSIDGSILSKADWRAVKANGDNTIPYRITVLITDKTAKVAKIAMYEDGGAVIEDLQEPVVVDADLTAYTAALAAVEEADYTEASWTAYQAVVDANVVTVANTQEEVDAATLAITTAQADLVFAGQADLDAAKAAEALLNEADYVDYSAVTAALALPETTNAEVVAKASAITDAIDALEEVEAPDTTAPVLEAVTPAKGAVELAHDENFVLTVKASDENLYELEVDHSLEGTLAEFSLYASADQVYGGQKEAFTQAGVSATYNEETQTWTIDFGETVTATFVEKGITFYLVVRDKAGNQSGSMYDVTEDMTFAYTVTKAAAPDTTDPEITSATIVKDEDGNLVLTVIANDENLYSLEVDHSHGKHGKWASANLPEFHVYADADEVYGTSGDAFVAAGLTVVYDATTQTWTLTFKHDGQAMGIINNPAISNGAIDFFLAVYDKAGNNSKDVDGKFHKVSQPANEPVTDTYTITFAVKEKGTENKINEVTIEVKEDDEVVSSKEGNH